MLNSKKSGLGKHSVRKLYKAIISSISLYTFFISISIFLSSFFLLWFDTLLDSENIPFVFSFFSVSNPDSARSLLSALTTGLVSLMVFSFTMVMLVLNFTSNNYTPRVLPTIISKKSHQVVLGIYLGTIAYTIITLNNIESKFFAFDVPYLTVAINVLLGFSCFIAFVIFIHNISQTIQIGNILKSIYNIGKKRILLEVRSGNYYNQEELPVTTGWQMIGCWEAGYFDSISQRDLVKFLKKYDIQLKLVVDQGNYLKTGTNFFLISKPLEHKNLERLQEYFIFRHQELISDNFIYGFKIIEEIAVKALSPGINDPGTALQAMDYLSDLFYDLIKLEGSKIVKDNEGYARLIYQPIPFETIFHLCFGSIKNYGSKDITVLAKLADILVYFMQLENNPYKELIKNEYLDLEKAIKEISGYLNRNYIYTILKKAQETEHLIPKR